MRKLPGINGQKSEESIEQSAIRYQNFWLLCILLLVLASCNSPYVPKQEGYFKISFPEKKYLVFNQPGYPYTFEYPVYSKISKDTSFFGDSPDNPWWLNISFPQFEGNIYVTYKPVKNNLQKLIDDAFNMTNKHTVMASAINDSMMITPNNIHGMFFKVQGEVATANQFFLTDSTKNFLRGALYFNATPNEDSLKPVNDFVSADMRHLINTFKWK
jgi:gliding motility-associated lipoprotein GldD